MIQLALVGALIGCVGCGTDDGGPRLASITPAIAGPGVDVVVAGTRLCSADCATTGGVVLIGLDPPQARAIVTALAEDRVTIQIPPGTPARATFVIVEVGDRASNALALTVLAPGTTLELR